MSKKTVELVSVAWTNELPNGGDEWGAGVRAMADASAASVAALQQSIQEREERIKALVEENAADFARIKQLAKVHEGQVKHARKNAAMLFPASVTVDVDVAAEE